MIAAPTLWASSIGEKYETWRTSADGRRVYAAIRDRALAMRRRGHRHYGIAALYEAARYDWTLAAGPDADGFRLNNNHRSRLARELMDAEPELRAFFALRELRAA